MNHKKTHVALAVALAVAPAAQAQQSTGAPGPGKGATLLPPVVITANPLGSELFDMVSPVSVLEGPELTLRRGTTLGETLNHLPGVNSTYFGPNASRPVIRGFDADRIRILNNGIGVLDASSVSNDHDVAVDPLAIERAEVVRGAAALLYGGSAVGGVVNVIDNRIPQAAITGVRGRAEARYGGAEREKSLGALFEAGNGRFALHADGYTRDTDDLRIPGFARSARLRARDPQPAEAHGRLPNSASVSHGGALGGSLTWNRGHLGVSYSGLDRRYGTVAEPDVTIDMRSTRFDVGGELREIGRAVEAVKFKLGHTDYRHDELDLGVTATTFRNKGYEGRLEAQHAAIGPLRGAVGVQASRSDFSALGAEAFVPPTESEARAVFLFEELALRRDLKLNFGVRRERTAIASAGGGPVDPGSGAPRFGVAQSRAFNANSGAIGAVYNLTPAVAMAVNGSHTERAPTFYELHSNGPHAATGAYEVGNAAFNRETTRSIDAALRVRSGPHSGSIGLFASRVRNFIGLFGTGNTRGADGEVNPVDGDDDGIGDLSGEEILPEFAYRVVPARFRGVEAEGRFRLAQRPRALDLIVRFDYVRAEDRSTGTPLPRIPPRRYTVGLTYEQQRLGARLDVSYVDNQHRVPANELPTGDYTMVNVALTYNVKLAGQASAQFFLRGVNLLNEEARNHVSLIKDIAPLGRRSGQAGVRMQF
ncbi:MAG: TonB-dependent receptor [Betaproteobacteria bacterium]